MQTTINPTTGYPGPVTYPGGTTNALLFNDMNIIIPHYQDLLFDRYGDEGQYGMLIMELNSAFGGAFRTSIDTGVSTTQQFVHYEKGRAFASGVVKANVAGAGVNTPITITLGGNSYYNSGTESAFRQNEYGYIGSTGVKFRIGTIVRTVANNFTVVLTPTDSTTSLASLGQTSTCLANEALLLVGNQGAGEASTAMDPQNSFIYKVTNTCAVVRDDYTITDVAKMNSTPVNFGGGVYSYFKLGQTELNKRFMYYIENLCIEGLVTTGLTSIAGTTGTITAVAASAPTVDYTIGSLSISDLQALARVWEYQNGPAEYHLLENTNQLDDVDTCLFGKYNNGAIRYASVGENEKAAVSYGFKSFSVKSKSMHFFNYKNFAIQTVYGLTPTIGNFRTNYGLCVPQGVTPDAKLGTLAPNMQWVYQEYQPGVRWLTYQSGGLADQNKTTTLNLTLTQAVTVGSRTKAPQQFAQFVGTY